MSLKLHLKYKNVTLVVTLRRKMDGMRNAIFPVTVDISNKILSWCFATLPNLPKCQISAF